MGQMVVDTQGGSPLRAELDQTADAAPATQQQLKPPRGAAIAGVIFSLLLMVAFGLVRSAVPADPSLPGIWLTEPTRREAVVLAIDLVPFAGIAFLWFIGVLRSRMGEGEDQFFATVFLASGLLFVTCLFAAAATSVALIQSIDSRQIDTETYHFARHLSDVLMNLLAIKMAAVFIFSTCTIGLRTAIFPRWLAFVGYACGVVLLTVVSSWKWITLIFPFWMLLISAHALLAELFSRTSPRTT